MLKIFITLVVGLVISSAASSADFSSYKLRPFVSPGFGVILNAPEDWRNTSSDGFFEVTDPTSATTFTASGYAFGRRPTLEQFARIRLSAVDQKMQYLKQVSAPYPLNGKYGQGIAAEYEGTFPNNFFPSHYLVLCILTEEVAVSFSMVATIGSFQQNKPFYMWLITNQLDVYKVRKRTEK